MNHYTYLLEELEDVLEKKDIDIDEPMKNHTSFRVGGPADILVTPKEFDQVGKVIKICNKYNIHYYIIGNGTNLLVRDGGIRGIVIKLTKLNNITNKENIIVADSGTSLIGVSRMALSKSLTGMEFACGIPGSVGGALAMNAGAYNGEISQVVESAIVVDKSGNIKRLNKDELELGYRMSAILKYGYTVLQVSFKLIDGDLTKIRSRMDDLTRRRTEKQPLEFPSAGSTFKRPEGTFAPKLIQESGLKGVNVGDAEVSTKHSGFIINKGEAKASDILKLIAIVQSTVKEKFNIDLDTEVIILGEDSKYNYLTKIKKEIMDSNKANDDRSAIII